MDFRFNLDFLKKGDIENLSISKRVGMHSMLSLQMRHSHYDPAKLAELIGQTVKAGYGDDSIQEDLFCGIVSDVEYMKSVHDKTPLIQITAYAHTLKADIVPRHRVFQDPNATLKKVCEAIIDKMACNGKLGEGNFDAKVPLSIQYNETDFDYLQRIAGAHGIPLVINDIDQALCIGHPSGKSIDVNANQIFNDVYRGSAEAQLSGQSFGKASGMIGDIQSGAGDTLKSPVTYFSNWAFKESQKQQKAFLAAADEANFTCAMGQRIIQTRQTFANVGDTMLVDGESYSVYATDITAVSRGSGRSAQVQQEHTLVATSQLMEHRPIRVPWSTNTFLAQVTKNESDPENLGRVQVRFDWEEDQSQSDSKQLWADMVTPYAGAKGDTYGFLMLPEVGEKVLVKFMGPWDDTPLITGSLRRGAVNETVDTARYKTLRTPNGHQINIISDPPPHEGGGGNEQIQIRAGNYGVHHIDILNDGSKTTIKVTADIIHLHSYEETIIESDGTLDMKSKGDMTIHTDATLTQTSKGEMGIQTDAALTVGSKAKMGLDSKAAMQLTSAAGTKVTTNAKLEMAGTAGADLQSTAMVQVKGAMIKLN